FSSRRRHTSSDRDWSSDVCSSDLQLADTDDMRAEVDINEADIAKVGIGSPVVVALDSYPDKKFDAALVKVYPAADRQKGTVKIRSEERRVGKECRSRWAAYQ